MSSLSRLILMAGALTLEISGGVPVVAADPTPLKSTAGSPNHIHLPPVASARLCIDYSAHPQTENLWLSNLCILDAFAEIDLAKNRPAGRIALAYLSAVEVSPGTPAAQAAAARGIPSVAQNADWGSKVLDITHPQWEACLLEDLVAPALAKGFDGIFLDTLDSVARIATQNPSKVAHARQALVHMIRRLHQLHPEAAIIINRGFECLPEVAASIDGVLLEGLFQNWDPASRQFHAVTPSDTAWLQQKIRGIQSLKLPVLVVDYVAPEDTALAARTATRIAALGCIPLITTPELHGRVLAPARSSGENGPPKGTENRR